MNLIEQLEALGLEYREHSSRVDEIYICCPFCEEQGTTPDTRFRLGINVVQGKFHCFNCDKRSSNPEYTWSELARALETGTLEAVSKLAKRESPKKKIELPPDFALVSNRTSEHWNGVALRYLQRRNISSKQIVEKNIGFSTVGEFRYRIIVPVYYNGELEGIVARAFVLGLEPKYKNSIGQKVIYNIPDKPRLSIVLTEGVFDALALEKSLRRYMDSGAVLGHSLTDKQMQQLSPYKNVVLWPDPDKAGLEGFAKMGQQLQEAGKQVEIILPDFSKLEFDPSELWSAEILAKFKTRIAFTPEVKLRMKAMIAFRED